MNNKLYSPYPEKNIKTWSDFNLDVDEMLFKSFIDADIN